MTIETVLVEIKPESALSYLGKLSGDCLALTPDPNLPIISAAGQMTLEVSVEGNMHNGSFIRLKSDGTWSAFTHLELGGPVA